VRAVRFARRGKSAAITSRNLVYAIGAHDFFDQIDIALQIAAIARDLPFCDFCRARLFQAESN
jgi:hypothetical protein